MATLTLRGIIVEKELCVDKLMSRCNPFCGCCWADITKHLTVDEINIAVETRNLLSPGTIKPKTKNDHIMRIAWFVVFGWDDPTEVDVGVPSLGCHTEWPIVDGNHRFAASIVRERQTIKAAVSGEMSEIKTLLPKSQQ